MYANKELIRILINYLNFELKYLNNFYLHFGKNILSHLDKYKVLFFDYVIAKHKYFVISIIVI